MAKNNYEKACFLNEGYACHLLGALYENGEAVSADPGIASENYRKACVFGIQESCDRVKVLNK